MEKINIAIFSFLLCIVVTSQAQQPDIPSSFGINLESIKYPYRVNYIRLAIQGEQVKMAYMDVKPERANGQTVVLLHGKNFNGAYWERTAGDLASQGYRVVIPDQIGFGKSSKPYRIQYSFQLLAQNTKAILDTLQIRKINLLGHSMGGMLAVRFALMYPETVERLVLENPIGLEDWKTAIPYQTVEEWYASELKQNYGVIKKYQLESYYGNEWRPEYDRWVKLLAGWTAAIDYPRVAWNSALLYDMIFTQPVCYEFENIKIPTLLIIGQRDRTAVGKNKAPENIRQTLGNYPALGKAAAKRIPNAQLVEIDNVGHLPHIEAYDKFIQPLMTFLKK